MQITQRNKGSATLSFWLSVLIALSANAASGAPDEPSTASVKIESVSTSDQHGGMALGYANQVNLTIWPPLAKGPVPEKLRGVFSEGAKLFRVFRNTDLTDAQLDELVSLITRWTSTTFEWLHKNVSEYAAERFAFLGLPGAVSYKPGTPHSQEYVKKWDSQYRLLAQYLINLDQLMRDPSIYPDPTR